MMPGNKLPVLAEEMPLISTFVRLVDDSSNC